MNMLYIAIAAGLLLLGSAANAAEPRARVIDLDITAQPLSDALSEFAKQSRMEVVFRSDIGKGLKSAGLRGSFTPEAALEKLLANTGLEYAYLKEGVVAIRPAGSAKGKESASASESGSFGTRVAQSASAVNTSATVPGSSAGDRSATRAEDSGAKLEEIVVTATKRGEERVQDIPMSIAVIGNQEIERRGLIGMEDYLRSIPGVNQIDRGGRDNAIVIRGITTSPEFESGNAGGATVATYFDETPITGATGGGGGAIDVRPVDIARIEVLRGPQGTAFGAASLGGTLRIIPMKPGFDGFSARVAAAYSNTGAAGGDNSMAQGMLNIPIVADELAVRAVGYRYDESGFYRNIAGLDAATIAAAANFGLGDFVRGYVQDDVGRMITTGARLAARWQATEKLDLSASYLTQKIEQDGSPLAQVGKYEQLRIPAALDRRIRGESGEVNDTNIDLLNLVANYELGWGILTSAASWVDGGAIKMDTALAPVPFTSITDSNFKSFTAETRLVSQLEGRVQFLAGLFYEDAEDSYPYAAYWAGTSASNPFATNPLYYSGVGRDLDQRAVFGEVSYDLTEKLTATVGGRYFKYRKDERTFVEGAFVNVPLGEGPRLLLNSDEGDSSFKANLKYEPSKDSLLYASWAQGFRLGRPSAGAAPLFCDTDGNGIIDGTTVSLESTRTINSDFLDSYEAGAKVALLDRRMTIDMSVDHIKRDGLPLTVIAGSCGYIANAGAATSDGVEIQGSFFLTKGLRVEFGGGYTKAKLAEDAPGLRAQSGARLPGSPEVSANLAAQYDFHIAGHPAFMRADSFYTGKFYGDLQESLLTSAGDYVKVDARAGIAIRNLSMEIFVRNLTNEDTFTWRGLSNGNSLFGYRLRPRTVGVQLGYSFN